MDAHAFYAKCHSGFRILFNSFKGLVLEIIVQLLINFSYFIKSGLMKSSRRSKKQSVESIQYNSMSSSYLKTNFQFIRGSSSCRSEIHKKFNNITTTNWYENRP